MKDGTPLIDEDEPKFIEMPSESMNIAEDEDDPGEVTVIRRNIPVPPPSIDEEEPFLPKEEPAPRIVVPMTPEPARTARQPVQYQQPQKPNTLKVVILTIFGTVSLLTLGGIGFWLLSRDNASNTNVNANMINANTNVNTNLGFDFNTNANFNANRVTNVNAISNTNTNTNTRTPTPTPSPSVSPTPRPSESPEPTSTPTASPTRTPLPTPSPTTIIIRPGGSPTPRTAPTIRPTNPGERPRVN